MFGKNSCVTVLILFAQLLFCNGVFAESSNINDTPDYSTSSKEQETVEFVVRFGQGGFRDSRSPENALGGGQLAIDIKPKALPVAFSLSRESYTNSADPTHSYEIDQLIAVNVLYINRFNSIEKLNFFYGGGVGRLKVPRDSDPGTKVEGDLINLEAGLNYLAFGKFGFYGVLKYLQAEKSENNARVIDFNEAIVILGVSYSFSL